MEPGKEKLCTDVNEEDGILVVKTQPCSRKGKWLFMCILLTVLVCVVSVCVIAIDSSRPEGGYSIMASQSSSQSSAIECREEDATWITCKYLSASFDASIFKQYVGLQQNGQCCVRDAQSLLDMSMKASTIYLFIFLNHCWTQAGR